MMPEYPFIRELIPPITPDQLRPLDSRCRVVQFSVPLSEAEFGQVADFLRNYPEVPLRMYGHYKSRCNLGFLRYFPFLRQFEVDAFTLDDLSGLRFLPDSLEYLGLGATRSKSHSLSILERFRALRELYLEGHTKDIAAIGKLSGLESLNLRSITLKDLSCLRPLGRLLSLYIKLGGTKDLALLPGIGKLRYLEIFRVRGLSDLETVGAMETLQYVFLESLNRVSNLPSFAGLRSLRRVHLESMPKVSNLQPVAEAPALEELLVVDMGHLEPDDFRVFLKHPTLRHASVFLGSERKNRAVKELLGLPLVPGGKTDFQFEGAG